MLEKKKGVHGMASSSSWRAPACHDVAHEAVVLSLGPFLDSRRTRRRPLEYCVVVL